VPALIADLGEQAAWRYVEFFTANVRNPHTRRAYARACSRFCAWCEQRGLTLTAIRPHDVATYIEQLQNEASAPSVKQQLAAGALAVRSGNGRSFTAGLRVRIRPPPAASPVRTALLRDFEEWRRARSTLKRALT
jgi:hypothetical protein